MLLQKLNKQIVVNLPKEIVFFIKKFLPQSCCEEFMERHGEVYFCGKFKYGIVTRDHAHNVRGR